MPLRVQNRIQVEMHPWMLVETTRVTKFEYYFARICSFTALNVALTLSFKLMSF